MKVLVSSYTFSVSAKTITFSDFGSISLDRVISVFNVTRGLMLYQAGKTGGASVATNVLTLSDNIGDPSATTDKLQIYYELGPAKFAKIAVASSGVNAFIAAVSGKKIRVLSYVLVANAAVNVKFQSHVTPTDLTGLDYLGANGGVSSGYNPEGHFETVAGEALDINLSGAVAVGGHVTYVEV